MSNYSLAEIAFIQEFIVEKNREYVAAGLIPSLQLLLDDVAAELPVPSEDGTSDVLA